MAQAYTCFLRPSSMASSITAIHSVTDVCGYPLCNMIVKFTIRPSISLARMCSAQQSTSFSPNYKWVKKWKPYKLYFKKLAGAPCTPSLFLSPPTPLNYSQCHELKFPGSWNLYLSIWCTIIVLANYDLYMEVTEIEWWQIISSLVYRSLVVHCSYRLKF